jgi:hypothetical protein
MTTEKTKEEVEKKDEIENILKSKLSEESFTALVFIDSVLKNYLKGIHHITTNKKLRKEERDTAVKHEQEVGLSWNHIIKMIGESL